MDLSQPAGENYANPKTCFFHVLFKAAALAFYILSTLFFDSFVIIFVVTVILAALDFWVAKNISGRILVGLRWWNEINEQGESVWKFECLDQQSLARMNKKDSWLFWWTLYLSEFVCASVLQTLLDSLNAAKMPRSRFKHLPPRLLPLDSRLQFSQHLAWYKFLEKKIAEHNNAGWLLNQTLSE